jgi:hypothetical protein
MKQNYRLAQNEAIALVALWLDEHFHPSDTTKLSDEEFDEILDAAVIEFGHRILEQHPERILKRLQHPTTQRRIGYV